MLHTEWRPTRHRKGRKRRTNTGSVPTRATITTSPPGEVSDILRGLTETSARPACGRRLRIQDIADRIGASRSTEPMWRTGGRACREPPYLGVLWALGLLADADHLADGESG